MRWRGRPFSPRPGSSGRRVYTRPAQKGKMLGVRLRSAGGGARTLDQLGEPHRKFDAFADLLLVVPVGNRRSAEPLQSLKQHLEAVSEKHLAKRGVAASARKLSVADRRKGFRQYWARRHGALGRRSYNQNDGIKGRLSFSYPCWRSFIGVTTLDTARAAVSFAAPSVQIPKFASLRGILVCELRKRRTLATY